MTKHVLIALTNPVEGREQEFNEWYDNQHVPDFLALPGCVSAQRFKLLRDPDGRIAVVAANSILGRLETPRRPFTRNSFASPRRIGRERPTIPSGSAVLETYWLRNRPSR